MWTEEQIKRFEKALQGPAPKWDANWEITQQLLKTVTVQSRCIINLQAQLDAIIQSNVSSSEALVNALHQSSSLKATKVRLTPQEVETAVGYLNRSIEAVASGQKAIQYAGNVLMFIAKVIV